MEQGNQHGSIAATTQTQNIFNLILLILTNDEIDEVGRPNWSNWHVGISERKETFSSKRVFIFELDNEAECILLLNTLTSKGMKEKHFLTNIKKAKFLIVSHD